MDKEIEETVEGNEEGAVVDTAVNPNVEAAQTFADDVASKVALVESGEMTLEEFVAGCTETLSALGTPEANLGGLGDDTGEFPELEETEEA